MVKFPFANAIPIEGEGGTFVKKSGKDISIRIDHEYTENVKVEVDGKEVDKVHYKVTKALYLCFNHLLLLFTVFICIKPLHHLFVKDFLYLLIYLIKDIAYYDDIFLIKLFSFYLNKLKLSNFLPIIK